MSIETERIKKELRKTRYELRYGEEKTTEEIEELERQESFLRQELYYVRLKEVFDRMGKRKNRVEEREREKETTKIEMVNKNQRNKTNGGRRR